MRDTWIDEHTGDELSARPAFEAELRAELARELGQPARLVKRRRTPWRALGWASVAAAAVVTTVVVVGNDDDKKVGPGVTATTTTVASTVPSTGSTTTLITTADVVGPIWAILSRDGSEIRPELLAAFRLVSDGPIAGFDNCNTYSADGWTLDANTVTPAGARGSTAVLCDPMYPVFNPFTDGQTTTLAFGADRNHLTLTGANGVYEAVRLDETTQVENGEVLGNWLATQRTSTLVVTADGLSMRPESAYPMDDPTLYLVDGQLFLTNRAGNVRVFETHQTGADEADLLVPAEGGPLLAPEIVATLDVPAGSDYSPLAILPDRFVIAEVRDSRFTGTIISVDRNGNRLPDTTLDVARGDFAGVVLGGLDGTLYMETFPEVENTQTTTAYVLDGTVWRSVDSYFVEENNDGSYQVTGDGLVLGDVVIPAQTPVEDGVTAGYRPLEFGVAGFDIVRSPAGGEPMTWRVVEDFDNFGLPPLVYPFGDGAIFVGNASGIDTAPYLAVLRAAGGNEFFRLSGWEFAAADYDTALFSQVVDGTVQLGVLGGAPRLDWVAGELFGYGIGFHSVDEVSATISAVYGEPTADSGWYTIVPVAPGDEDCLAGRELRVLHWGDLSVAFQMSDFANGVPAEFLWSWVVGDLRGSGFGDFREPTPAPAGTPTELTTSGGIGLGTPATQLGSDQLILSDFPAEDGSRGGQYFPSGVIDEVAVNRGLVVDADGVIIGFGATQASC
jgi:hypothetical protein